MPDPSAHALANAPAPAEPCPPLARAARAVVLAGFAGLVVLGMVWEFWLAPLRPGGSLLALKVLPLVLGIPGLRAGRLRNYQAWSMGILIYLCEGLVRATSDPWLSARLAVIEVILSVLVFCALLVYVRVRRGPRRAA